MANKKIEDLTALGTTFATADIFEISRWTGSAFVSRKITGSEMSSSITASNIGNSDLQVNSSLVIRQLQLGGSTTSDGFAVRNFADTKNFLTVLGDGQVWANGTGSVVTNTSFGQYALDANTTGGFSVAMGYQALSTQTTQTYNVAIGHQAMQNSTGSQSVGIGHTALQGNTASFNTGVGVNCMTTNTSGQQNVAMGHSALNKNNTGSYNTAIGYRALFDSTSNYNTAIGNTTMENITGQQNTSMGFAAFFSASSSDFNTGIGANCGYDVTTGDKNTFIGYNTGRGVTTGSNNTVLGTKTGLSSSLANHVIIADGAENDALTKDNNHNIWLGDNTALATTATNGFNYVRGGAGVPTGTPATAVTGHVPMYADTTNNKLYIYSGGAWVALN